MNKSGGQVVSWSSKRRERAIQSWSVHNESVFRNTC